MFVAWQGQITSITSLLLMARRLFGARASATIMMTFVGGRVSGAQKRNYSMRGSMASELTTRDVEDYVFLNWSWRKMQCMLRWKCANWSDLIDHSHISDNTSVLYPTMFHSEQKCAHPCYECCIVGYGTDALYCGICEFGLLCNRIFTKFVVL